MEQGPLVVTVEWALFCHTAERDAQGAMTAKGIARAFTVTTGTVRPWLIAALKGAPDSATTLRLRLTPPNKPAITVGPQPIRFKSNGFTDLQVQLPPLPLDSPGDFTAEFFFGDDAAPSYVAALSILPVLAPGQTIH